MLEIQRLRSEKESVIEGLKKRHFDASEIISAALSKDEQWRAEKTKLEEVASKMNQISKQIGILFKEGKVKEANEAKAQTSVLKSEENTLKEKVDALQNDITE
jgi:seryl-tRNA synthetase